MIIYKATNITNGKCYIGKTIGSLKNRKYKHIRNAENYIDNTYFHKAIRKYNKENFKWEIVCKCSSIEELNEKEKYYILYNHSYYNDYGYNLTLGGDGGDVISNHPNNKEIRKKMSIARTGNKNPNYGVKMSIETRQKMSKNHADYTGIKHPRSKTYEVLYPTNEKKIIKCLKTFCDENNLIYSSVKSAIRRNKPYKGFTIKKYEQF